ncbi:hypothetical protein GVX82_02405 [Patescibacteria group bacterium]|jgi:hypothetical protein|nr:hypothetical protein [Patescibacteria group bacterium]
MHDHDHMHEVGPLYCETPLSVPAAFPVELINTVTSLVPSLFGVLAIVWLWRVGSRRPELYTLGVLAVATGVGSALWHGLRTPLSLALDVFPGVLYFLLFTFLWTHRLGGYRLAVAVPLLLATLVIGLFWLEPSFAPEGPPLAFFVGTALVSFGLIALTYRRDRRAGHLATLMIAAALLAAGFRTIDLATCGLIPFGTHFLWHVFLGAAVYLGVRLLATLKRA